MDGGPNLGGLLELFKEARAARVDLPQVERSGWNGADGGGQRQVLERPLVQHLSMVGDMM